MHRMTQRVYRHCERSEAIKSLQKHRHTEALAEVSILFIFFLEQAILVE